ncbi:MULTISPECIES: nicotinate phosphoribosyltransferase [Acinetobacter]|uniref:Nicotinate phosphoribosyltransferase n=1 Tax=Acinetobacter towneri TaxID=202956 RepID=A0AAP4HDK8_9GAMM|nr:MULTISPECIES: nicotinate phosphoribosyltransferase [Acinetobacter]NLN58805.1 nicotinate phosphoribosyltransferase [Gammaproteobacteria bacterium]MBT0887698.1 nicotinate phosphoribosyltransferase [Acinetobacter towneri]MCA4790273.1 nicotinate phosphoribosyltransferase [Acinetobacter towneri]MCA4814361.1 nicotinate phosphoribosyltransferase [Acinetobacter towneri]MCO8048388.1 nicotinate phosphoribosyltransferase [Acinetobacter towneri]
MTPIIQSLLDTDLYKFTMLQVVLHKFPQTHSVYQFRCRNLEDTAYPLSDILAELNAQLDHLCQLKFKEDELQYLRNLRFIKSDFVDYLELFQLKRRFIHASIDAQGRLDIRVEGPMVQAMMFEIFVLAIVNELYFQRIRNDEVWAEGERRLQQKIALIQSYQQQQLPEDPPFLVSDFGTRRRYSFAWQKHVIAAFHQAVPEVFRGTSNVLLAKELGITPIGTMAHEFLQAFQALDVRLRDFQKAALETWVQEYRGDLGIALTDVVGMDAFLRDFDLYFAKLFDGLRHDSGDPYVWGDKAYAHYKKLKIDSKTKMLTFSDGLNVEKAWALHQYFKDRFQVSFGIGTNLTNDMGQTALNIVLKLVECNGQSVAKLSDSPGKTMTDNDTFLAYLRQVFEIQTPV